MFLYGRVEKPTFKELELQESVNKALLCRHCRGTLDRHSCEKTLVSHSSSLLSLFWVRLGITTNVDSSGSSVPIVGLLCTVSTLCFYRVLKSHRNIDGQMIQQLFMQRPFHYICLYSIQLENSNNEYSQQRKYVNIQETRTRHYFRKQKLRTFLLIDRGSNFPAFFQKFTSSALKVTYLATGSCKS